jgi:TP901 family phage tail tape measure protein
MSDVGQLNVRVGMDSSGFQNGISNLNREMKRVQSEFQLASSELGKHGSALDGLRLNSDRLTRQTEIQRQKVEALEAAHQKSVETKGADARATQELEIKLNKAKATLNGMEQDLKSLNQEIAKQESGWYKMGKALEPIGQKMQDIGKGMQSVGKNLTRTVTLPLVGLGAAAIKVGMDFEAGMSEVAAISGATGEEFEKLSALAKEMGATTKFSASQSAEAMKYMAMAGWDTTQMLDGLEGIMMLAAASGESLASVSDIVTDALTAFGMSAGQSAEFADLLANTASSANVNVATMGETFKYAAPLFGALGYSAEDAALAIGLMGNAGIKGSQAGTALRGALTSLADPSGDAAVLMKELGLSITDASGEMKPFKEVMDDLRSAFGNLDEAQQAQAASTLFGRNAMSGMLAIINASETDYAKLTEATREYSGAAGEMAEIMEDNLQGQLTKLKSALEGVGIQIFEILVPHLNTLVAALMKAVEFFANLPEPVQTVIVAVAGLAAALGPVIYILGSIVAKAGVLISAFSKISIAIAGKTAALGGATAASGALVAAKGALAAAFAALTAPIALVVAAIVAVIGIGYLLIRNWDTIKEVGAEVWTGLKDGVSRAVSGIGEGITLLKDWFSDLPARLSAAFQAASAHVAQWVSSVQEGFAEMVTRTGEKVVELVQWFRELPERVGVFLLKLFFEDIPYYVGYGLALIVQLVQEGIETTVQWFSELPERLSTWLAQTVENMALWWETAKENTIETVTTMIHQTVTFFSELPGKVGQWLQNTFVTVRGKMTEIRVNMVESMKAAVAAVIVFFMELPAKVGQWLSQTRQRITGFGREALSAAKEAGKSIVKGIMDEVLGLPSRVATTLRNIGTTIRNAASSLWSSAKNAGASLTAGWKDGMGERSPSYIERSMSRIVGYMDDSVSTLGRQFQALDNFSANPTLGVVPALAYAGGSSGLAQRPDTIEQPMISPITIEHMHVRDDSDIEKIAVRLHELQRKRNRGV